MKKNKYRQAGSVMSKIKVLIIHENILLAEGIKSHFDGHDSIEVAATINDVEQIVSYLKRQPVDLIIIGECANCYKNINQINLLKPNGSKLFYIIITYHINTSGLNDAIKHGVTGYFHTSEGLKLLEDAILNVAGGDKYYSRDSAMALIEADINKNSGIGQWNKSNILTKRELEILNHISYGKNSKEISGELSLSPHTIETHRKNIMKKLEVKNSAYMIRYAFEKGLIN